jgi:ABC-type transport system involved in cytochrome bd biosynthesis fused ATPase/permease subunit
LVLCRALCELHKDVVLLDDPTSHLSESQESEFFRNLRVNLRRDQVIIVTCTRFSAAIHGDKVVVLSPHGDAVLQQGSYAQLISQPGMFRDELMPPPRNNPPPPAYVTSMKSSVIMSANAATPSSTSFY